MKIRNSKQIASTAWLQTERVLFALSAREREIFLRYDPEDVLPELECRWFDPASESDQWGEVLQDYSPTVLVSCWSTPPVPASYIESPDFALRYICHTAGSVRKLVPISLLERGILITNWGTLASQPVAEHALLLILASLRQLPHWPKALHSKGLRLPTRTLIGQKVGLHGFGKIARELIDLLRPFNVTISAYSAGVPKSLMIDQGVTPCDSLEELFSTSTILVECEALTPQSTGSVTRAVLERLPSDAVFVNVGRALVVDELALAELAEAGRIQIALDVYSTEPLPRNSRLLNASGAILSPHIGGPTEDLFPLCGDHALANLSAYLEHRPLTSLITPEIYHRST